MSAGEAGGPAYSVGNQPDRKVDQQAAEAEEGTQHESNADQGYIEAEVVRDTGANPRDLPVSLVESELAAPTSASKSSMSMSESPRPQGAGLQRCGASSRLMKMTNARW